MNILLVTYDNFNIVGFDNIFYSTLMQCTQLIVGLKFIKRYKLFKLAI